MRKLREKGFEAARLSSLQEQRHREGIMEMFRRGEIHILVATDVAGRGIDVGGITHVINYDIPMDADDYVHRIGRTARAGAKGHAITFVTPRDLKKLSQIRQLTGMALPVETYGDGAGTEGLEAEEAAESQRHPPGRRRRPAAAHAGHHRAAGSSSSSTAAGASGGGASGRRRRRGGRGRRGKRGNGAGPAKPA